MHTPLTLAFYTLQALWKKEAVEQVSKENGGEISAGINCTWYNCTQTLRHSKTVIIMCDPSLRVWSRSDIRLFIYYVDHKGKRLPLTFVQYFHLCPAEVEVKPHGNSHSTDPYLRSDSESASARPSTNVVPLWPPKISKIHSEATGGGTFSSRSFRLIFSLQWLSTWGVQLIGTAD